MSLKCKAPECEECPEWIFTFADLVMLMMGFFVILWVLKPAPGKQQPTETTVLDPETIAAIRKAFGWLPDPKSKDPIDQMVLQHKLMEVKPHEGPGQGGETKVPRDGAMGTDPETQTIRKGPEVGIGGRIIFDPGSDKMKPEDLKILDDIVTRVRGYRNIIMIKGHAATDDLPESAPPQALMDLSVRRAQAVASYLAQQGLFPDTLRIQGCSIYEPVKQRAYSPAARANNRRVEIEVTSKLVTDNQDPNLDSTTQPLTPINPNANH